MIGEADDGLVAQGTKRIAYVLWIRLLFGAPAMAASNVPRNNRLRIVVSERDSALVLEVLKRPPKPTKPLLAAARRRARKRRAIL